MEEYTPELYQSILGKLNSQNLILLLTSPDYDELKQIEPIYNSKFEFGDLDQKL